MNQTKHFQTLVLQKTKLYHPLFSKWVFLVFGFFFKIFSSLELKDLIILLGKLGTHTGLPPA